MAIGLAVLVQVLHLAGVPRIQPSVKGVQTPRSHCPSNPAQYKPKLTGLLLELLCNCYHRYYHHNRTKSDMC